MSGTRAEAYRRAGKPVRRLTTLHDLDATLARPGPGAGTWHRTAAPPGGWCGAPSQYRLASTRAGTWPGPGTRLHAAVHSRGWPSALPALSRRTLDTRAACPVGCRPGGFSAGCAAARPAARTGCGAGHRPRFLSAGAAGGNVDRRLGFPRSEPAVGTA